jgi:hypothetical protein
VSYELITKFDSKNFTPAAAVPGTFRQGPRRIESITIHWWGMPEWGDTFEGVIRFLCTNNKPTSAHEVIEAGRVAVLVAHGDASWAAGNALGNTTSIHLECRPRASDADYATVAERIRDIREMHGKDLPLIPHRDWQATMCPGVWDLARLDALARSGSAAIGPMGEVSETTEEGDELSKQAEDHIARLIEIAEANERENIRGRIVAIDERTLAMQETDKYVKGADEPQLYEINEETGELRNISGAEWEVTGKGYRILPQATINRLLGKAA